MRRLGLLAVLGACRPVATAAPSCGDGCLLEHHLVGEYSKETIEAALAPGVTIDNGYAIHDILFRTDGAESRATVAIPIGVGPPDDGWDVVANNHGTVGIDDPCALHGTVGGAGLAGLFGARGAIGVAVDYPGLGTDGVHPYLVARSEGAAALDGVRAALALAASLGVPTSGRAAMVGLSQGGHATLAAAAMHATYAPDLDVRGFAVSGPATVWERHWRAGAAVAGPHIPLVAMMLYAWRAHYGWADSPFTPAVDADVDAIMTTRCVFTGDPTIPDSLSHEPAEVLAADVFDRPEVHAAFEANAIRPYTQTAPLRVYQGDADDVVLEAATREVVDALRAGGVDVDYQVVRGGGHVDVAFGFVAYPQARTEDSIAWVRAQLAPTR